jgi:hypothetical protein
MSGHDMAGLIERIDASIEESDERIQTEVEAYLERHPEEVGKQIAETGYAKIPTFAGMYTLTEDELSELAGEYAGELETVAG